jgi:hypothetical protein
VLPQSLLLLVPVLLLLPPPQLTPCLLGRALDGRRRHWSFRCPTTATACMDVVDDVVVGCDE